MPKTCPSIPKLEKWMLDFPRNSSRDRLNACALQEDIETVEQAFNICFSECYKQFLLECDGGMITEYDASYYIDMTGDEPDGPRYSSFNFFSLQEVYELYDQLKLDDWMMQEGYTCVYPIIPIGRTPQQKLIFMLNRNAHLHESPIFMSLDFEGYQGCIKIANDFDSYLSMYLEHEGFPPINLEGDASSCKVCMKAYRLLDDADGIMAPEAQVVQYSALIKLYPEDAWYYCMRGLAYQKLNQREAALADYNASIQLNDKKSFFYFCRGDLLLDHGSKRKALIDLDKAVQLEPDDPLYLARRGRAFYRLEKYSKALADCNNALTISPDHYSSLMTRIHVYRALGEERKAETDEWRLEEIWDGQ